MATVNKELYNFLKDSETGATDHINGDFECWVHIDKWNIKDFIKWMQNNGDDTLHMAGYPVFIHNRSVRCDIVMLMDMIGHKLSNYKDCFEWWNEYKHSVPQSQCNE